MARPVFEQWFAALKDLTPGVVTARNTGGTDHQSFDAVGLPGFQFIQDEMDYGTRTPFQHGRLRPHPAAGHGADGRDRSRVRVQRRHPRRETAAQGSAGAATCRRPGPVGTGSRAEQNDRPSATGAIFVLNIRHLAPQTAETWSFPGKPQGRYCRGAAPSSRASTAAIRYSGWSMLQKSRPDPSKNSRTACCCRSGGVPPPPGKIWEGALKLE